MCVKVMALALKAAMRGLPAGITDAGTACWMARAGLEAAVLNVRINLLEIADEEWKSEIQEQVSVLLRVASEAQKGCQERLEEILDS